MKRVLVIEYEDKLRSLLARIIRAEGFDVQEAANAQSGIRLLEETVDVVLCDVKLPDANGVTLVHITHFAKSR